MAAQYVRPGRCQHPMFTDSVIADHERRIQQSWGSVDPIKCPDCGEYLYPHGDPEDGGAVYVGEPYGAGDDPAGRPNAGEHPEFWTE